MQHTIQGHQIDIGEALRNHITDKLDELDQKYFNRAMDATVTLSPEGSAFYKTHISIRVGKNIMVMSDAQETDPYGSFDEAAKKLGKRLRRHKKRLRDHHSRQDEGVEAELIKARDYVLAALPVNENEPIDLDQTSDDILEGDDPVIVADMQTHIETLSVSDAVMRMDLADLPAMMFRNAKSGDLNMVYRRSDGAIGWVDPENTDDNKAVQAAE